MDILLEISHREPISTKFIFTLEEISLIENWLKNVKFSLTAKYGDEYYINKCAQIKAEMNSVRMRQPSSGKFGVNNYSNECKNAWDHYDSMLNIVNEMNNSVNSDFEWGLTYIGSLNDDSVKLYEMYNELLQYINSENLEKSIGMMT